LDRNNLGTGVAESAGIGSGTLALTAGGQTPDYTNISQEFTADLANFTITSS
jgi:hypothetical protein